MPRANIAEIKAHLSSYLTRVERGEDFEICRRNVPIARLSPIRRQDANRTVLGSGLGTVVIHGDVTEPVLDDWEMHR
jgi:prevent-host-death family protein